MNKETVLSEAEIKQDKADRIMEGVNIWTSFYRANPQRFARDYLGLKLKRFQQIILCMMFKFTNLIFLASRGIGKTFLIAVFCVIYCILYPGSIICVAAGTRGQSTEVLDKIQTVLMPNSPNLCLEIQEIISYQAKGECRFKNGSVIKVVTSAESARHNRATVLIADECRMIKKEILDTVLRKFLTTPRHPGYLDKPEYKDMPIERTKEIYASSCWYEAHWLYQHVRTYVENMLRGRSYFCCAMPYQLAICENLLDRERVEDEMSEADFNEVSFRMEMEALFYGQSSNGLYNFEEIDKRRQIKHPFYPKSLLTKISDKRLQIPQKQPGEKRLLSADIALMATTAGKKKNDATSIFINQMLPINGSKYTKNFIYTTNNEGLRTDTQALIIRRLFHEFDCDYLIIDVKGNGLGVVDALMTPIYDNETGITYEALSCYNNEEIAARCAVKNAPKKIWAIQGSVEFNSRCAIGLREELRNGLVRLLISEYDAEDELSTMKGYSSLPLEEKMDLKLPYIHTTLLVNEMIKLQCEIKNGSVRVKEEAGMRKDRYSSIAYNIFVARELERDNMQNQIVAADDVIMGFKRPLISKNYSKRR